MILRHTLSRRALLTGSAAAFIASRARPLSATPRNDPFALGVASGYPGPDGAMLWTRLAPEPLSPDPERPGGMPPDSGAGRLGGRRSTRRCSRSCGAARRRPIPDFAHSVHVECRGLEPGREYWYRFIAGGEASPIGRLRTAPAPGAPLDRLRFGFASCANYELGYFSAYRHLADENPDLVLFLGDYIYEYVSQSPSKVREHSDGVEATDLRTYRNRYAQYRPTRTSRRCTQRRPASRSGTTTRCRTITPITGRRISTTRSSS